MQRTVTFRSTKCIDTPLVAAAIVLFAVSAFAASGACAQVPGVIAPAAPGIEGTDQIVPERQSVAERARLGYDPVGLRFGSFLIFPRVDLDGEYNSNVFASQTAVQGDALTSLRPSIDLNSDWGTDAVNFHADGEFRRYANLTTENENNAVVAANGQLDILRNIYVTGGLGYQLAHEERTSPNVTNSQRMPTFYQLATGDVGFVHESGRIGLRLNGDINEYSYNNNQTSTGVAVPESYRDRGEYIFTPRLSYRLAPGYEAFIKTPINYRVYNAGRDPLGFKQNSHGYEVDAGTAIGLGSVLSGDIFVGYLSQIYDAAPSVNAAGQRFGSNPASPNFGGDVLWNASTLDSLRLRLARSAQETTIAPASSYLETNVSLTQDHQLQDNVLLSGQLRYTNDNFEGVSRMDNVFGGTVGVRYLMNRYLSVGLSGTYTNRQSNAAGQSFGQTIGLINVRLQD